MGKKSESRYFCDWCKTEIVGLNAYSILNKKKNNPNRCGFCSNTCMINHRLAKCPTVTCVTCSSSFSLAPSKIRKNNFCSKKCLSEFRQLRRGSSLNITCLGCGEQIVGARHSKRKFHNRNCQTLFYRKKYLDRWKSGDLCDIKNIQTLRKILLSKFGNKCSNCGWGKLNPVTGSSPLEVEHIDGNSGNNLEENLTILCPNCHSLTPTYKNLNRGHGRHSRRERYRGGKSY